STGDLDSLLPASGEVRLIGHFRHTIFGCARIVQSGATSCVANAGPRDGILPVEWSKARMPQIVNFHSADDPRDVVHQVVQLLAEGQLVGLPTETGYAVVASPLQSQAVERLIKLGEKWGHSRLVLALKNPLEALDYVPNMGTLGRKLIRRFWPGPVTLLFED